MNGIKLFGIVFAAVLAANITAPMLIDLRWEFASDVFSAEEPARPVIPRTGLVKFKNASDKVAQCELRTEGKYLHFLILTANESKRFDRFKIGSAIRCWTFIGDQSTTVMTYLTISSPGEYEIMKDRVACSTCNGRNWRWATVVVDPNGVPHYSKLKGE